MRQIATQCTRKSRDVESKCGGVGGRLPTKDSKVIIEYSQHTNVEKLDYFGGGYVVLYERLGSPKIRMTRIACTLSSSTQSEGIIPEVLAFGGAGDAFDKRRQAVQVW
jgi:hypothetical protein